LTQLVKPTIIIGLNEIGMMHEALEKNIDSIADPGSDDKLRTILRELGHSESYAGSTDDIQMTLNDHFPDAVDDGSNEGMVLFTKTKLDVIAIMRQLPKPLPMIHVAGTEPTLMEILKAGAKWAKGEENEDLLTTIDRVKKNLAQLEDMDLVSEEDGHRQLLKAVTLEIANRAQIMEQQNKELARLQLAIRKAGEQKKYLEEKMSQYDQYLRVVRERHVGNMGKGKRSKDKGKLMGPFKFTYPELVKKHVIVDSEVPSAVQKATRISITSEEAGVFDVEVTIPGLARESIKIYLDDLLEKQSRGMERDERTNITLDVNMMIHLLNKLFRK